MNSQYDLVRRQCRNNTPPVEVNQTWQAINSNTGEVMRELRILAIHPDLDAHTNGRKWIYEEQPRRRLLERRIGVTPEFNLRYVFSLKGA